MAENQITSERTKHIDLRHHFIREHVLAKNLRMNYVSTDLNIADVFTKPLDQLKFKKFMKFIISVTSLIPIKELYYKILKDNENRHKDL